jgi:prepilin-type N-terminal cleavage/methylation domain-containing protein
MKTRTRNIQGYTLVELMVVVAVAGTLMVVAKTNYDKFVAKARQSEAKIGLSAIYSAEQTFFSEFYTYTACLRQIGFVPDSPNRYYLIGFGWDATNNNVTCGPNHNRSCAEYKFRATSNTLCSAADPNHITWPAPLTASDTVYSASMKEYVNSYYNKPVNWHLNVTSNGIPTAISATGFLAGAAGVISSKPAKTALHGEPNNINSASLADGWSINDQKQLINAYPGI